MTPVYRRPLPGLREIQASRDSFIDFPVPESKVQRLLGQ